MGAKNPVKLACQAGHSRLRHAPMYSRRWFVSGWRDIAVLLFAMKEFRGMNLSAFIRSEMTEILAEWTAFAKKTAPADGEMSNLALTDHAEAILCAIAIDIETHQSKLQQFEKSQGNEVESSEKESAAAIHGRLRQASNFSLFQLSSEFRALRATVLRLWLPRVHQMSETTIHEMVRFNEAIDQALAESIVTFSARAERTRDLFLAVLGHDLRAPLATISLVGDLLTRPVVLPASARQS
jgi:signal transduction histidine kinase